MRVLTLNCGSSTLKFKLIETSYDLMEKDKDKELLSGVIARIGSQALIKMKSPDKKFTDATPLSTHRDAIHYLFRSLEHFSMDKSSIEAVGHRIVHGGEHFQKSVLIDASVMKGIESCIELAPLHNPANLKGIQACKEILGASIPHAAVFDTAFHASMPELSYLYAIPYQYYRRYRIRRYGFHGTSHRYLGYRFRHFYKISKKDVNIITLHLGNGCSACAIQQGQSLHTSMGMTPLEGLVMGTRSGNIDPAIIDILSIKEGLDISKIDHVLNKESGLLGVSGITNDMKELLEERQEYKDRRATLAIELFCQSIRFYLGAYLAMLNPCDAIVFSGGIGENAPLIRKEVIDQLEHLGLKIDAEANLKTNGALSEIQHPDSTKKILVIPTNEELLIARDTMRLVKPAQAT